MENNTAVKLNILLKKYTDLYAMYVEYPHKSFWTKNINEEEYKKALKNLYSLNKSMPLLLYVHIPFCMQQCYYCTCHTFITRNYEKVKNYLSNLCLEIHLLYEFFNSIGVKPTFREIHLGGGSPTILKEKEFDQLIDKLKLIADIDKLSEFAIELDPRVTTLDMLRYYHEKGINRISFGVQDFELDVQKAINRIQPAEMTEKLLTPEIRQYFHGINFDIMWGLPRQTRESFKRTIDTAMKLSPDRISLLLLHYAPEVKKHQKLMKVSEFPSTTDRAMIFNDAVENLLNNGYVRIGLEHFAKTTDELAIALKNNTLHWNNLGYTTGRYDDIIGIGPWSASAITSEYYFQNVYSLSEYENTVKNSRLPIYRGYKLNKDDIIRRDIIHNLRSYFFVDYHKIEQKYNITFSEYFKNELSRFDEFVKDGILKVLDNTIKMTELGKYFTMQVCRVFDSHEG